MRLFDLNRKYVNQYPLTIEAKLKEQLMVQDEIIRRYRALQAYHLSQPWYTDHLPEIRKHVEEVITPISNKK